MTTSKYFFKFSSTRQTCARRTIPKKESEIKTFRLFFRVRTRNSLFSEKREFFYSFIFPLSLFQKSRVSVWLTAFQDWLTQKRPALHPSAFILVFYGIAHQSRKGLLRILTRNSVSTTCFPRSREAQFEHINFFFKTYFNLLKYKSLILSLHAVNKPSTESL